MNSEIIKNIIDSEIDLNQYIILESIRTNSVYLYPKIEIKLKDVYSTLQFFGYIHNTENTWKLTIKGANLLGSLDVPTSVKVVEKADKYDDLYQKIQAKLLSLTGKKNPKANGEYYFLPSKQDFASELEKCIKKYNLKDFDKVSKCLLNYTQLAYNQKFNYIQLLKYFISKNNKSTLAEQYENFEDMRKSEETKTGGDFIL